MSEWISYAIAGSALLVSLYQLLIAGQKERREQDTKIALLEYKYQQVCDIGDDKVEQLNARIDALEELQDEKLDNLKELLERIEDSL